MKRVIVFFLFLLLSACAVESTLTQSNLRFFPDDYSFILKANKAENLWSGMLSSDRVHKDLVRLSEAVDGIQQQLSGLIPVGAVEIALYPEGRDALSFLALSTNENLETSFEFDDSLTYDDSAVGVTQVGDQELYYASIEGRSLISNSTLILQEALRGKARFAVDEKVERLYASATAEEVVHLVMKPENSRLVLVALSGGAYADLASSISLDISQEGQLIKATGISFASDSLDLYLSSFAQSAPIQPRLLDHAPRATKGLLVRAAPAGLRHPLLNGAIEIGRVDLEAQQLLYVRSIASEQIIEELNRRQFEKEDYMGIALYQLTEVDFSQDLESLGLPTQVNYVALYEDAFWYSTSDTDLQSLIKFISSEETFKRGALYASLEANIAQEISLLYLSQEDKRAQLFSVVKDAAHYFTAATSAPLITPKFEAIVSPVLSLSLDAPALTDPQFVKNHYTNAYEIVVQDASHALYRFSNSGARLWKRQLDAKIQGRIHEVDLFRNKKLQLAFTTETSFVFVDRNGNYLDGFPKRFQDGNLSALSVFDYDNSRNYRMVFSQGRDIYMLNNAGEKVNGFTYTKAESELASPAKHFRIASKDYLLFPLKNGTLKVLQRDGKDRLKLSQRFDFTSNELFEYRNTFAFTDQKGALVQIDTRGKVSRTDLGFSPDHLSASSSKTLVLSDQEKLQIKEKRIELEYGIYEGLRFFYVNDTIYISLVDKASKQLFVYNSQGELLKGFPVIGISAIDLIDMDNDKKVELVTADERNSLTVYRIE
ncbi:MAG: hypothetical protein ISP51_03665 [Flavobacteriaceae bacterium]|nr:hypothetical protein [Flavobacteriaceae bacterium]